MSAASTLVTCLVLFAVATIVLLVSKLSDQSYGASLDQFISSRNPQNTFDVERLTREFDERMSRGFL